MKIILLIASTFMLYSCFTATQKVNYFSKQYEKLKRKYNGSNELSYTYNATDAKLLGTKPLKKQNRKEINNTLKFHEKIFALSPDSIFIKKSNVIDSFYSNKNKIKYIRKHNLKTTNIYFIEKNE
jgi:hypothetical protein